MNIRLSSRATLLVIAALFVLPLVLAWLMYSGTIEFKPASGRNLGTLVQPPIPVDWENDLEPIAMASEAAGPETLEGHWVVLHVVPPVCASPCLEALQGLRQVHKASGKDQRRIRIALLLRKPHVPENISEIQELYPLFQLVQSPGGDLWRRLERIAAGFSHTEDDSSYLIDPIGNIMMFYEAGSDPNHLKKDLKRLLTWSKLDK